MKYVISTEECDKLGIKLSTFLYLLSVYSKNFITESCAYDASSRSLLTFQGKDVYNNPINPELTEYGLDTVEAILKNSEKHLPSDEEISMMAETLRSVYPNGKKPGTPYPWKDSKRGIELRLKKFFILYGQDYTEEQIVNATREYVEAFKGDYRFMRLLKYFIWKKEDDGTESSELASFIDNAGQEDESTNSWVDELR